MGNNTQPRIDEEDMKLLELISIYGFVDMCFILRFYKTTCRQETVERRITQLAKYQFLEVRKMFIPHDYVASSRTGYKTITLGKLGLQMMNASGYAVTDYRATLRNSASYRVYHQVQVATVCESMKKQFNESKESKFRIDRVLSEKDSILPNRTNQPDAILLFERKDSDIPGKIAIFVEIERSYASKDRINSKLESYYIAIHDKLYNRHLKIPIVGQRVLFVSQTDLQSETIMAKVEQSTYIKDIEVLVAKYSDACDHALNEVYYEPSLRKKFKLLQRIDRSEN